MRGPACDWIGPRYFFFYFVYLKVLLIRVEILMILKKYYAHATHKQAVISGEWILRKSYQKFKFY
jgi:hypothetical protein